MANIILVGFMCTGKTQVGKHLADSLGLRFADADAVVEARAEKSIARIFTEDGEAAFHQLERKAIAHLSKKNGLVIATGAGVLNDRRNLTDLRRSGTLVCLTASPQKILERLKRGPADPLLQGKVSLAQIKRLLKAWSPQYEKADFQIDTTQAPATRIAAVLAKMLTTVPVALGERSYEIIIGRGLLSQAESYLEQLSEYNAPVIISEERVWENHGEELLKGLPASKRIILPALKDTERLKSLRFAEQIYDKLLDLGVKRDSLLIAFGGGTIGDLAGFVAATYMRGVDFVQIPSTLLAQVDASVGGKVAVNHARGKNLIGAFWQPRMVLADLHCLDTLPRQELRNGLAEIIKHALLADARLFRYLEEHVDEVMRLNPAAMRHLLWRNCHIKAEIVSRDEREGNIRALLNLGHTFGHALETTLGYHGISHGEAVSIGMMAAARLANKLGYFSEAGTQRLLDLLHAYHLPTVTPEAVPTEVMSAMKADKKALSSGLRLVIPERIGKARIVSNEPLSAIRRALFPPKRA